MIFLIVPAKQMSCMLLEVPKRLSLSKYMQ